jgi:hypothetical protein
MFKNAALTEDVLRGPVDMVSYPEFDQALTWMFLLRDAA